MAKIEPTSQSRFSLQYVAPYMQGRSSGELLDTSSAVALLGPRQVGKTMIVSQIAQSRPAIYLDLETDADPAKLAEPELYLGQHDDSCHSR